MRLPFLGLALIAALSTAGAWALLLYYRGKKNSRKEFLRFILAKKRASRRANFDRLASKLKNLDGTYDKKIVELSFKELREKLQNEQLTPVEVLLAYQDRALSAQNLTNCVTEFVDEADELTRNLTAKYSGKPKPYLYGVPFSLKECYQLKGYDNTLGLAQFIDDPCPFVSPLVAKMESLGAVPFARTNLPSTMMSIGSYNPVFGATTNPYDPERRCSGGSSSGEAALLACRGSILGLGTDIGGSVRTPAHCCGVASLKPTWGRMCQQGRFGLMPGQLAIKGCSGLMARDVDALVECCKALWADFDYDICMVPLPFRESMLQEAQNLKIGYYWTDGLVDPVPACRRAVLEARDALQALGHRLVEFRPFCIEEFYHLYSLLITADNGRRLKKIVDADIEDKVHDGVWFQKMESTMSGYCRESGIKDLSHFHELCSRLSFYKRKFAEQMQSTGLDCILCPVFAGPAMPHGCMEKMFPWGWTYCSLYNLLDFPAGVVPICKVKKTDVGNLGDCHGSGVKEKFYQTIEEGSRGAAGMPLGVQIVARPYQEETCLAVMKQLENCVKFEPLNLHI